jgi:tryptophanase
MFPTTGPESQRPLELVRMAIPRRVYSASHLAFVADVVGKVHERRANIRGVTMTYRPERLPHFTARYSPKTG